EGPTRNLTGTPAVHERNPKWSPDGKHIACISDASGEDEIHLVPQDGNGPAVQLTNSGGPYKYALFWSPDSKKIMWADKKMRLFYVDVATKAVKQVAEAKRFEIRQYVWSPDSKWIAYARPEVEGLQKVWLYSLEEDKAHPVTDGWYSASDPEFSADGKVLFFASARDFEPIFSQTEWNHAYADLERIYLVTLAKETPSPFAPKSDEVSASKDETSKPKDEAKDKDKEKDKSKDVEKEKEKKKD